MKIMINGGYGINYFSNAAMAEYMRRTGKKLYAYVPCSKFVGGNKRKALVAVIYDPKVRSERKWLENGGLPFYTNRKLIGPVKWYNVTSSMKCWEKGTKTYCQALENDERLIKPGYYFLIKRDDETMIGILERMKRSALVPGSRIKIITIEEGMHYSVFRDDTGFEAVMVSKSKIRKQNLDAKSTILVMNDIEKADEGKVTLD